MLLLLKFPGEEVEDGAFIRGEELGEAVGGQAAIADVAEGY
jgi:hypothetical protein